MASPTCKPFETCLMVETPDLSETSEDILSLGSRTSSYNARTPSSPRQGESLEKAVTLSLAQPRCGDLKFTDISYSVPLPKSLLSSLNPLSQGSNAAMKPVLSGVSGVARTGEVTAIMGASGSGKTTLLDVLAHRISPSKRSGSVCLGDVPVNADAMRRQSGYVMQDDLLYSALTVYETLLFAARLRLPPSMSLKEKKEKVQSLLSLLGLEKAANTFIGDENRRGVSGGERKRVSIGVEMIADPALLFLDEPTSGLDSTSAYRVVSAVRDIAVQTGSVAVMVLHQVCGLSLTTCMQHKQPACTRLATLIAQQVMQCIICTEHSDVAVFPVSLFTEVFKQNKPS